MLNWWRNLSTYQSYHGVMVPDGMHFKHSAVCATFDIRTHARSTEVFASKITTHQMCDSTCTSPGFKHQKIIQKSSFRGDAIIVRSAGPLKNFRQHWRWRHNTTATFVPGITHCGCDWLWMSEEPGKQMEVKTCLWVSGFFPSLLLLIRISRLHQHASELNSSACVDPSSVPKVRIVGNWYRF